MISGRPLSSVGSQGQLNLGDKSWSSRRYGQCGARFGPDKVTEAVMRRALSPAGVMQTLPAAGRTDMHTLMKSAPSPWQGTSTIAFSHKKATDNQLWLDSHHRHRVDAHSPTLYLHNAILKGIDIRRSGH